LPLLHGWNRCGCFSRWSATMAGRAPHGREVRVFE
jgi:hypothetical protein